MKEHDLMIGKTIYGWTDIPTKINNWHDPFFNVWREAPRTQGELYPAWSISNYWAGELMYDMIHSGFQVCFETYDHVVDCYVHFGDGKSTGHGASIPAALAHAISELKCYNDIKSIKLALEVK